MELITPETEGVFHALPASIYHSAPGVSQSMLKHLARSPAHLRYVLDHPEPATPAMLFGRIAHQLALEPNAPVWWIVRPEGVDLRTAEGKDWKKSAAGKTIIDSDTWGDLQGAIAALQNHSVLSHIMREGKPEVSLFKNISLGGRTILRRARVDLAHESNTLLDLKFVDDASPEAFSRKIFSLRYFLQAAYYLDTWNDCHAENKEQFKDTFVFVAIETSPPYAVGIYNLNSKAIELGRRQYLDLLPIYAMCSETNDWPAYPREVKSIDLPRYAYHKSAECHAY